MLYAGGCMPKKRTNQKGMWAASSAASRGAASSTRQAKFAHIDTDEAEEGRIRSSVQSSTVGIVLDAGSGHTSVLWYSLEPDGAAFKVRQLRRANLKTAFAGGSSYRITDAFEDQRDECLADAAAQLADSLRAEIEEGSAAGIPHPVLTIVGATGGLRNQLDSGKVDAKSVTRFESLLVSHLEASGKRMATRFFVITGEQEAAWELAAAHIMYGPLQAHMFPVAPPESRAAVGAGTISFRGAARFGLFSGGGSSMQIQANGGLPLSFPFSTWCSAEMDEALGAAHDAWKVAKAWEQWERSLVASIDAAVAALPAGNKVSGCFVLTAMCHVAASAAGFAERPITAGEAVVELRAALAQFRAGRGEPYESFVAGRHAMHPTVLAWYSTSQPHHLARVGAMHLCRLAHVLERLFEPSARLYAPAGVSGGGERLDCEWTVECFVRELRELQARRAQQRDLQWHTLRCLAVALPCFE